MKLFSSEVLIYIYNLALPPTMKYSYHDWGQIFMIAALIYLISSKKRMKVVGPPATASLEFSSIIVVATVIW